MSSKTFHEGKAMERNPTLHSHLKTILKFDSIAVFGDPTTKGDVVGRQSNKEVPISIKHGSQKNTQVHLPTLNSFSKALNIPLNVTSMLEQWLGVSNQLQFESWLNGNSPTTEQKKYKRLFANDISDWGSVVNWFNINTRQVAELLIQEMNGERPAEYLVWVYKNKNKFQIIDIHELVEWIITDCKWVTGPRNNGSTLRCENKEGKPIFHLQMKGNRIKDDGVFKGEYNHNPQFHIHINWPEAVIIHEGKLVA